jgi:phosphoribosylglycinamide formyltransferase 1
MLKIFAKAADFMLNIAVFGSGRGSNFKAILDAIDEGTIPGARIVCVISNNSAAGILEIARTHSIPAYHLSQKNSPGEETFAQTLLEVLQSHSVNLVVLAGYMKLLHPRIIATYRQRIINIHPALLPKFGGKGMYGHHVHEAVIRAGERESGASVHFVDEVYDHGTVILQKTVPVLPDDTPDTLAARVLTAEHEIYPEAVRRFARGEIIVPQRRPALART